jgi:hypothetical protein
MRARIIAAIAAGALILALGAAALWFFVLREDEPQGHTDRVTLVVPAVQGRLYDSAPGLLASMHMTGGTPSTTAFEFSLMAFDGTFLPDDGSYTLSAELTNLNDGTHLDELALEPVEGTSTPTWTADSTGVDTEGWWRIRADIGRPEGVPLRAEFIVLIDDPNMRGFTAPPAPETDPEAARMLQDGLTQMSDWSSLRWWEWLSGGDGSMITVEFSVTTPDANGQPPGFQNRSTFAGRMVPGDDGEPPAAPRVDYYTSVTVGDEAWQVGLDGTPESRPPTRYLPIQQYPETYEGATSVQLGLVEAIDGHEARIVTFHVPTLPTQSEAWYAFWIDVDTGDVVQLAMVAMNHYMVWEYFDVSEPFVLEFPPGVPAGSPQASPAP